MLELLLRYRTALVLLAVVGVIALQLWESSELRDSSKAFKPSRPPAVLLRRDHSESGVADDLHLQPLVGDSQPSAIGEPRIPIPSFLVRHLCSLPSLAQLAHGRSTAGDPAALAVSSAVAGASVPPTASPTSAPEEGPPLFTFGDVAPLELPFGLFHYRHVCIEEDPEPERRSYHNFSSGAKFEEVLDKKIVIYSTNTSERTTLGAQTHIWPVEKRPGPPPPTHRFYRQPAYFLGLSCEGNLNHWLEESMTMLYQGFKVAGRLDRPHEKVQILLNKDSAFLHSAEPGCHGLTYKDML
jgi:hypothetical protein